MIKDFSLSKELVLEKNPYWDPATDPARTQYPDGYDFKLQQQSEKIDQIMLADTGDGQTTLTYDDLLAPDFQQMKQKAPEPADPGRLAVHLLLGAGQPEDHRQEGARGSVVGLPLQERDPRRVV